MRAKTFDELIASVTDATPFDAGQYPALKELTGENAQTFKIAHSLHHLAVSSGYMQKAIEHSEHGDPLDIEMLKKKLFSATFTICKLCEVLGISEEELFDGVESFVEIEKNKK